MGTLGLGDLLGLFQCEDDSGLEHITISALAKGDVGVGTASRSPSPARGGNSFGVFTVTRMPLQRT